MAATDAEPYLIVKTVDMNAPGSYAEFLELQDFAEDLDRQMAAARTEGKNEGRIVQLVFEALKPRIHMSDGSDPKPHLARVSIKQVKDLVATLKDMVTGAEEEAVNPPNGGSSGSPPSALATNGHRSGSKVGRLAKSGTSRPG